MSMDKYVYIPRIDEGMSPLFLKVRYKEYNDKKRIKDEGER